MVVICLGKNLLFKSVLAHCVFGFYTQHFTFRSFSDKGCVKKEDIVPIEELESVLRVNVV